MKGYLPNMLDEKNTLDKVTEIVAPELYNDGAKPTVQEVGKIFARPFRAINAAFSRVDKWIHKKECSIEETPIIPQDVPQEPSQLQKDLETIQYSIDHHFSDKQNNVYLRLFNKYKKSFSEDDVDSLNKKSSEPFPKYDNLLSELQGLIESLQE